MALNVLFIGSTGQISCPCVERAVVKGPRVSVYSRGLRGEPSVGGSSQDRSEANLHVFIGC